MLFAVVGICEFVYMIKMFLYFPSIRTKNYSLIFLKKGFAIKQINFFWQKIIWHGEGYSIGIVAVADDIDEWEFSECQDYVKNKNIILYRSNTYK